MAISKPSSTIQATAIAGFVAATILLIVKAKFPIFYLMIPADYQLHMVVAIATAIGWYKKENVLPSARP